MSVCAAAAVVIAVRRIASAGRQRRHSIAPLLQPQLTLLLQHEHVSCAPGGVLQTLSPEPLLQILLESDKIYGVSHTNRISQIDVISREDALTFLQTEEAAAQRAAAQQQPAAG